MTKRRVTIIVAMLQVSLKLELGIVGAAVVEFTVKFAAIAAESLKDCWLPISYTLITNHPLL